MGTICEEKQCIYRNNKSYNHCGTCAGLYDKPLKANKEPVAEVPCSVGLSDAERDMDMLFCLAITRTFGFGSSEMCRLLDEYREIMKNKNEMLEKIKGE